VPLSRKQKKAMNKNREKPARRDKAWEKNVEHYCYEPVPASDAETHFRHSNWATKRKKVLATLRAIYPDWRTADRVAQCGAEATIEYCKEEQRFRIKASYCKNRHCEPCQRAKGNLLAANLRKKLEDNPDKTYRFVTLTLKHTTAPLADQIKRLYDSWKKLRKERFWKNSQKGGCAILEVKWSPGETPWHPHLHIITEGGFFEKRELSAAWLDITKDSHIVDVKRLTQAKDAAFYVAKYVGKGCNSEVWDSHDHAQEWVTATKGVRTAATFGTWRGFKLLAKLPDKSEWKPICTLNKCHAAALRGEIWAISIMTNLNENLKYNPHKKRNAIKNNHDDNYT
jgi:Replication protein